MNQTTKLLFTDLDGTLLNDKKQITPGNMQAIHQMLAAGHKVVLSTGRATSSAVSLAKKLGLTSNGCYAITFNGACIYDLYLEKSIFLQPLSRSLVRRILDFAYEHQMYAHTYDEKNILTERNTEELQYYHKLTGMDYTLTSDVCQTLSHDPEKVIIIHLDPKKIHDFQPLLMKQEGASIDSFFSSEYFLEVVAPGVSKGNAIRVLSRMLDIPMEHTVSAGDAQNDISMLETTKIGAVMKNADPEIKKYGNYVTEHDNNEDGIAEIIYKFIL